MGDPSFTPIPIHDDPPFSEPEWQDSMGSSAPRGYCIWTFQRPTRIDGFELRGMRDGSVIGLRVGNTTCFHRPPAPGQLPVAELGARWVAFCLPVAEVGARLQLELDGFEGEIRPLGVSVR